MTLSFRYGDRSDAAWLAESLRAVDEAEAVAIYGDQVEAGLDLCIEISRETVIAEDDGELLAVFGIAPFSPVAMEGFPWCFTGNAIKHHRREFLRGSIYQAKLWKAAFPKLSGFVDDRHQASKRWLEWLGFELGSTKPIGVAGLPFRKYEWSAD